MSPAILFHLLCDQHVSDINISIIRSLRLCCWITTSVVLFSVRCCASACNTSTTQNQPHQISNTQRTEKKTTDVVIHQHSRKLLMMDILMSETCWSHNKWNKIASDIKLLFHSSAIHYLHLLFACITIVFFTYVAIRTLPSPRELNLILFDKLHSSLPLAQDYHLSRLTSLSDNLPVTTEEDPLAWGTELTGRSHVQPTCSPQLAPAIRRGEVRSGVASIH